MRNHFWKKGTLFTILKKPSFTGTETKKKTIYPDNLCRTKTTVTYLQDLLQLNGNKPVYWQQETPNIHIR